MIKDLISEEVQAYLDKHRIKETKWIIEYDTRGRGAAAYRDLAKEFLLRHGVKIPGNEESKSEAEKSSEEIQEVKA